MIAFSLRWLLFGLLLTWIGVFALAVWLERRRGQERGVWTPDLEKTRAVLERAPFGLLTLDGARSYDFANPYARSLLGLSGSTGQLPKADWVTTLAEDRIAARQDLAATGRYRSVPLPSEQFVRWWVTAWGERDIVCLWDTTAQQRAEQTTRFMLSDLSHELRTPLATILTHLEVSRVPNLSEEMRQQSIDLMAIEARRMVRLVNNLLELSRLEALEELERRPVDLLALVEEAIVQIRPRAEEHKIHISLEAGTPLPLAVGDPDRLKQIFLNLLDNTVKYARPGDRAVVSLRRTDDGIICAVRDTGPGIPAEHLPHVTRRFYRGVPEGGEGGSGLGLALVEGILRRHRSRLEIESQADGDETGTIVRFVLPTLPEPGGEAEG